MKAEIEFSTQRPDMKLIFEWRGRGITFDVGGYTGIPLEFVQEVQRRWNAGEEQQ